VLVGPSGVGKGTVLKRALELDPTLWLSVSATGRSPRPGEVDGIDYFFVSPGRFEAMVANGRMLEWARFAGNQYGTPREAVEQRLQAGRSVVLEIDLAGARQVRANVPDAVLVFLEPPTFDELERRLRTRGTEDEATIAHRLQIARTELAAVGEFDHVLVNADVQEAAERLVALAHGSAA